MTTAAIAHFDEVILAFIEALSKNRDTELPDDLGYWKEHGKLLKKRAMQARTPDLFESILTAIAEHDSVFKQLLTKRYASNGHIPPPKLQEPSSKVKITRPEQITPPLPEGITLPDE